MCRRGSVHTRLQCNTRISLCLGNRHNMQQLHIPGDQDQVKSKQITSKLSTTNTHIAEPLLRFFFG